MAELMTMFRDGGPFMWAILVLAMVYVYTAVTEVRGSPRAWLPVMRAVLHMMLAVGVLGTMAGWSFGAAAVARADAETKASLAAMAFSIGTYPLLFALAVAVPAILVNGIIESRGQESTAAAG